MSASRAAVARTGVVKPGQGRSKEPVLLSGAHSGNDWELDNLDNPKLVRLQEFFSLVLTKTPPLAMIADYVTCQNEDLQQFVLEHMRNEIQWSTGIGLIEAAQNLIEAGCMVLGEAIANGNLLENGAIP